MPLWINISQQIKENCKKREIFSVHNQTVNKYSEIPKLMQYL